MDMKRNPVIRIFAILLFLTLLFAIAIGCMVVMPGDSYPSSATTSPPTSGENHTNAPPPDSDKNLAAQLRKHVSVLSEEVGERNAFDRPAELEKTAVYIEQSFAKLGYRVTPQVFSVDGVKVRNLETSLEGSSNPEKIIVLGAHYDSAAETPAANDNGTGVAALLELARLMKDHAPSRTIRLVAFVNEEPPYFQTDQMGSVVYARRCKARGEDIVAAIALETMGYYTDEPGSQKYPPVISSLYPDTGNFIAFVGNTGSRSLVRQCVKVFRENAQFPSEGAALPGSLPGIGWSDHWAFWQEGYDGLMVTDTAPFRYAHYHEMTDTIDKIDFDSLALIVEGLVPVVKDLAKTGE